MGLLIPNRSKLPVTLQAVLSQLEHRFQSTQRLRHVAQVTHKNLISAIDVFFIWEMDKVGIPTPFSDTSGGVVKCRLRLRP